MAVNLVFLACAIGARYEKFLPPFIFFALKHNPNSWVEVVVRDKAKFEIGYEKTLDLLKREGFINFHVREFRVSPGRHFANTYRFLEVPETQSTYTYIPDVDIMFLKDVAEAYSFPWPDPRLPYNNSIRPSKKRSLTGLHFVKTKQYFIPKLLDLQAKIAIQSGRKENDEIILTKLCTKTFGLPHKHWRHKPKLEKTMVDNLGIHFSPNRGPNKGFPLRVSGGNFEKFLDLEKEYFEIFKTPCFARLSHQLKNWFLVDHKSAEKYQELVSRDLKIFKNK